MCGIAGYFGTARPDPDRIKACLALMRRRGPDARGVFHHTTASGRHLALLHTRLSIIDLDPRANQPFQIGPRQIVFNGELYNYVERRADLARGGWRFTTSSDTEVLLATLARDGLDGLRQCEGMWAFAQFDADSETLLLSRDRFGEKPLFLLRDADGLYFGSEIKFLFTLRGRPCPPNTGHLYRFLVNGYKSLYKTRDTFFEGVAELPRATSLTLDASGKESLKPYWTPDLRHPDAALDAAAAAAAVRAALIRSVELRLRADVPLAFCMSGGVDSNALISIARRELDYDVHGFTITNTDARYEEQEMVDVAVKELGIRHTAIPVDTTDFLPNLRLLVRQHDAPVLTISYYAHWLLMESIHRQGYRIAVSGTAADELFSGYFDHHAFYLAAIADDPDLCALTVRNWEKHVKPIVRNPLLQNPRSILEQPERRDHIYLFSDEFAAYLRQPWGEPFREEAYAADPLRNRMLNELFHEAVPVILHEDDHNAMYYSIENRSPFLDRELCELSYRIPTRHLIHDGRAKAVLRAAMRGIVPDPILDNPRKVGFNAPLFSFLDRRDPGVRRALLSESPVYEHVRRDRIATLLDEDELPNSQSKFLFYFLSAKLFLEEFTA